MLARPRIDIGHEDGVASLPAVEAGDERAFELLVRDGQRVAAAERQVVVCQVVDVVEVDQQATGQLGRALPPYPNLKPAGLWRA